MNKNRDLIDKKYKWCLEDIISQDDFEKELKSLSKEMEEILKYRGILNKKENLKEALEINSSLSQRLIKIYQYAFMKEDENGYLEKAQKDFQMAQNLYVKYTEISSYISPELSSLDEKYLNDCILDKNFENYDISLKHILESKKHILSDKEEKLLAQVADFSSDFEKIFSTINDLELKFGKIKDENGDSVALTHGNFSVFLSSKDRNVRKKAFMNVYKAYESLIETITNCYAANIKVDNFSAKIRNYDSALAESMAHERVSDLAYFNLLEVVNDNLYLLHRYCSFRAKCLNLDKIHMYDMHVSIFEHKGLQLEYDEAYKLVVEALSVLGDNYKNLLIEAYNNSWIDVYENEGKRSGAYSNTVYAIHPYVLLNYYKTTHDVFTIAHEMGHSIHSYFSNKEQCFEKASYEIFVAEVASTVNEVILLKYLISTTDDVAFKKYLLSYYLDMFRTTLFRQTQFAEFEQKAHKMAQSGQILTKELLSNMYHKLNKKYYGPSCVSDKQIRYEWARIPHFYSSFYVYKYATGITSAVVIAKSILSGKKDALENYYKFLSAGSSKDPLDILRIVGINLETKEAFEIAMKEFSDTLSELEKLNG